MSRALEGVHSRTDVLPGQMPTRWSRSPSAARPASRGLGERIRYDPDRGV